MDYRIAWEFDHGYVPQVYDAHQKRWITIPPFLKTEQEARLFCHDDAAARGKRAKIDRIIYGI